MNVDKVVQFGMELNYKKCMEMIIDFRKNISPIPPIYVGGHNVSRTKSYKLLGIWLDYDLKWKTNTDYIIKKATNLPKIIRKRPICLKLRFSGNLGKSPKMKTALSTLARTITNK